MLQRARQSLEGLSVGDAFGERFFAIDGAFLGDVLRERALPRPPWRYTDDTVMALSIYEVLAAHGRIDQDALAAAFARRYLEDPARGYGAGAHDILRRLALGEQWQSVSPSVFDGQGSMGNGGAMRVAPLGAYFAGDLSRAAEEARASAEVTHAHPEGQAGAIAIAVAAAWVTAHATRGAALDPPAMFAEVLAHTPEGATRRGIVRASEMPLQRPAQAAAHDLGNGRRVTAEDTVPFCLWCAARHLDSYEDAIWATVSALGDIDTNCAIVGGVVVCATGVEAIPARWRAAREPLALTGEPAAASGS